MPSRATKNDDAPAVEEQPVEPTQAQEGDSPEEELSNWEFIDRVPTRDEVLKLLETLPSVWGIKPVDYAEYVQALPSTKKMSVRQGKAKVDRWFNVYTLYFGVAGRQKMLNDAQEKHGWQVTFRPEPVTPSGVPGFVEMDERLVYREYVEISAPIGPKRVLGSSEAGGEWHVAEWTSLGSRPGTAWVPRSGGKQAAGSNPYEKVETSARGRAIAAWGFGVLPGSGIASLEEMLGVPRNLAAVQAEAAMEQEPGGGPVDKEELQAEIRSILVDLQQATEREMHETNQIAADWFANSLDLVVGVFDEDKKVVRLDLSKVARGQLIQARNAFRRSLAKVRGQAIE